MVGASAILGGALLPLATAGLLGYAGLRTWARRAHADARSRGPLAAFAVWWSCAAAVVLLAAAPTLLTLVGVTSIAVFDAVVYLLAVPLALGLFALLYDLLYIYTGRTTTALPLAAAYVAFFVFEIDDFAQFGPRRLEETLWQVRTVSDVRPPSWMSALFGALVAAPILAAILAYASLFPRAKEAQQRYRIATVSAAFFVWFVPLLVGFLAGFDQEDWFPLVYELPGLFAASLIVLAFRPPRLVEERLRASEG